MVWCCCVGLWLWRLWRTVLVSALAVSPTKASAPFVPLASRWRSIAQHLQNPDLYDAAAWAHHVQTNHGTLLTSRHVKQGQILSLVPLKGIDIVPYNKSGYKDEADLNRQSFTYAFAPQLTRPHEYHRAAGLTADTQVVVQAPPPSLPSTAMPGWMGHLGRPVSMPPRDPQKESNTTNNDCDEGMIPNCRVVPLLGALSLCALVVAVDQIPSNTPVTVPTILPDDDKDEQKVLHDLAWLALKHHAAEIAELRSYMAMAHPFPQYDPSTSSTSTQTSSRIKVHSIDASYPGVRTLHHTPDIYQVDHFLTPDECQAMIDYAQPRLQPCLIKHADTWRVEADPTRTSTNANLPRHMVPTVTTKICRLLRSPSPRYLEMFQVLRYTAGQTFQPHTDGFDGPTDACGFEQSGRLVTLFCYLNTMEQAGGETRFPQLDHLSITPVQGRAVLHFPNDCDSLQQDLRTEHESMPVVQGEKWLLVTWCWKHALANPAYDERMRKEDDQTEE